MNRAASMRTIRNRRAGASRGRITLPRATDAWARAREWHNPLRQFTLQRAITLTEDFPRGEFADLMWTLGAPYNGIETADADLLAIIERRVAALAEMDWNAQPKTGDRLDAVLAAEQADAVHEMMDGVGNLYAAIDHLALAFVRGFAHCEIVEGPGGIVTELRPVDQWHVVRQGIRGPWRYNPDARQTNFESLPPDLDMPAGYFVLREVARPIGRIALLKYARQALNDADWGAYCERYGIASGIVTMPPDTPPDQEAAFQAAAEAVAEAASGALPHGATWTPNSPDKGSGTAPFEDRLKWLAEKLVLAGTGGKLTMLAESGSGTLAGEAHAAAFASLARADARDIGEAITKCLVEPWLRSQFPGRPLLAYWELAFREETEASAVIDDAAKLTSAGYSMSAAELAEKTGYELETAENAPGEGAGNREGVAYPPRGRAASLQEENGVRTAETGKSPSESISGAKIENRQPAPNPQSATVRPSPNPQSLESMLADLLRGGVEAWTEGLAEAVAEGAEEEEEEESGGGGEGEIRNSGTSDGNRKGWETRRRNGWTPKSRPKGSGAPERRKRLQSIEAVLDAAFTSTDSRAWAKHSDIDQSEAEAIRHRTKLSGKEAPDLSGWKRILEADKVNKILPKHIGDAYPVEEEDFRRLPELLAQPERQRWEEEAGKPPRLRSEIREGRKIIVVEEAYTGQNTLALLSIYRP